MYVDSRICRKGIMRNIKISAESVMKANVKYQVLK